MPRKKKQPAQDKSQPLIRDRITELIRLDPAELEEHPLNWRAHPEKQAAALAGVLEEVGLADAALVRKRDDGIFELIDGHLRKDLIAKYKDVKIPCLVLDVTENEAATLLITHDPIAEMATANRDRLDELMRDVAVGDQAVADLIEHLAMQHGVVELSEDEVVGDEVEVDKCYQVVAECEDETSQQELFERLEKEGYTCRLLTL